MKLRAGIGLLGFLLTVLTFSGCNIFSWSDSPAEGQDLLEEGLDYMFDGDFEAAESLFALGLKTDSLNSDLLYNHAKATLLSSGESIVTIINELAKYSEISGPGSEVPFLSRPWPGEQNNLYVTNIVIFKDLEPIFQGNTSGSIGREDISLDIFIANTVKGILTIADTDNDKQITNKDFQLNLLSSLGGGFEFDSTLFDSLSEEDLNNLITNVGEIIESNEEFIGEIFGETDIDTSSIDSLLDEVTGSMEWYYVNTLVAGNPGEGDNDGDGVADDECIDGKDNDGDFLIDEDSIVFPGERNLPDGNTIPCSP